MSKSSVSAMFTYGLVGLVAFIIVATFVIGRLVDKKIGDIQVNVPTIHMDAPNVIIKMNGTDLPVKNCSTESIKESFLNVRFDDAKAVAASKEAKIEDDLGCKPIVVDTSTPPTTTRINIGCTKDADCNVVNGDGKNICKSDGTCSCIGGGSGLFCHYGPVNYRDPKDMSESERRRFKSKYRGNMTLQDYKNWLMLYKDDPENLRERHQQNFRVLMQGGQLTMKDVPALAIQAPTDAADYFQQMYKDGNIAVIFPENEGPYVGANYGKFDSFEPPEYVSNSITGVVNAYKPGKDNAFAADWFMRPPVTSGQEEQRAGDIYQRYVQTPADIRAQTTKMHSDCAPVWSGLSGRKVTECISPVVAIAEFQPETSLKTFESGDISADLFM
jgi:hypothetical protein